jgi:hypothetical protein
VLKYQYSVKENDGTYQLEVYDRHGRRHFTTDIDKKKFDLFLGDVIVFQKWMEVTFDDVFDRIS